MIVSGSHHSSRYMNSLMIPLGIVTQANVLIVLHAGRVMIRCYGRATAHSTCAEISCWSAVSDLGSEPDVSIRKVGMAPRKSTRMQAQSFRKKVGELRGRD